MVYKVIAQMNLSKLESYLHDSYRDKSFVLNTYQSKQAAERYAESQRQAIDCTNLLLESISVVEVDETFTPDWPEFIKSILPKG